MVSKVEFEKLDILYSAIKDLDKVIESDSKDKFQEAIDCIKNINKNEFDDSDQNMLITQIRESLLKIYIREFNELNKPIGIAGKVISDPILRTVDTNSKFRDIR